MPQVTIPRPAGQMSAHLAVPTSDGPWPGVVVVHDALGMTSDLRHQADWLADAGFLALAPDLYWWGARMRCLFAAMRAMTSGQGRAFEDLEAARTWLADRDDCSGRIGVIGFCLGGGIALAVAGAGGYSASSVNYGAVDNPETELADACPVVGSYGGRDGSLRTFPMRLAAALDANGVAHDVKVYADAGHGFLNDHPRDENPMWARFAGRFVHAAYHEPSAVDARRRITAFFDRHLRL